MEILLGFELTSGNFISSINYDNRSFTAHEIVSKSKLETPIPAVKQYKCDHTPCYSVAMWHVYTTPVLGVRWLLTAHYTLSLYTRLMRRKREQTIIKLSIYISLASNSAYGRVTRPRVEEGAPPFWCIALQRKQQK